MVGTDGCKPCWGIRGEVCGSVCHSVGGTEHSLGPLENSGRPEPLTGKQQNILNGTVTDIVDEQHLRFDCFCLFPGSRLKLQSTSWLGLLVSSCFHFSSTLQYLQSTLLC